MNKKIIFYIPSIEGGGVEKNLYSLIKYLPKKNNKIHIITANRKNNKSKGIKYICPNSDYWNKKNRKIKNIICIYLLIKNFWSSKAIVLSFQCFTCFHSNCDGTVRNVSEYRCFPHLSA